MFEIRSKPCSFNFPLPTIQTLMVSAEKFKQIKSGSKKSILFLQPKAVIEGVARVVCNDSNREEILVQVWRVDSIDKSKLNHQTAKQNGYENQEQMIKMLESRLGNSQWLLTQVNFVIEEKEYQFKLSQP